MWGYAIRGVLMVLAAGVRTIWGASAASRPLESVSTPLSPDTET